MSKKRNLLDDVKTYNNRGSAKSELGDHDGTEAGRKRAIIRKCAFPATFSKLSESL